MLQIWKKINLKIIIKIRASRIFMSGDDFDVFINTKTEPMLFMNLRCWQANTRVMVSHGLQQHLQVNCYQYILILLQFNWSTKTINVKSQSVSKRKKQICQEYIFDLYNMGNSIRQCCKQNSKDIADIECYYQQPLKYNNNCPAQIAKILSKPRLNYMNIKQINDAQQCTEDIYQFNAEKDAPTIPAQAIETIANQGPKFLSLLTILQMEQKKAKNNIMQGIIQSGVKIKNKNYLDEYFFIKEIGKGSYATVVKTKTQTGVSARAAKIIKAAHVSSDPSRAQKLYAQICVPLRLDHPNLVKLYQIFQWKAQYVLMMQLCEGGDLFHCIRHNQISSQEKLADIMKQILFAVNYMHKLRVVHRDLRPQNILFDMRTQSFKVCDFGCATLLPEEGKLKGVLGSAYYIAPQVLAGEYDQKCDIWSCGVILYMMLCGSPPFNGKSQKQVFQKIQTKPLEFKNPIWKKHDKEVKLLIKKMLQKKPEDRISAEEAFKSKWFTATLTEEEKEKMTEIQEQVIKNFSNFHFKNKLKTLLYTFIGCNLCSNKDRSNLMRVFKEMDVDGDGVIEKEELMAVFNQKSTSRLSESDIQKVLNLIDTNKSGRIDFTEFLVAATNQQKMLNQHRLNQAFNCLDTTRNGSITIEEVKSYLDGASETSEQIDKIFKELDVNGDGQVSKKEFIAFLLKKQQ